MGHLARKDLARLHTAYSKSSPTNKIYKRYIKCPVFAGVVLLKIVMLLRAKARSNNSAVVQLV